MLRPDLGVRRYASPGQKAKVRRGCGRHGPLWPGQHVLSSHLPPDKDTEGAGGKAERKRDHTCSGRRGNITVVSALTSTRPSPRGRVPPQLHRAHLAHAPTTGSRQRICWRGSGIRPGRTLRRRAHVRRARQGTARLAGNRQNPAARKGFNFAEGTLPGWYNHGACVGVSHAIFQLFYKCEFS